MKGLFTKVTGGLFRAVNLETEQALERVKVGDVIEAEWKHKRNGQFMKKFHVLIRVGFDIWEPSFDEQTPAMKRYGEPQKNIEQYRANVTVAAGYYEPVFTLNGDFRLVPKSIAFANMSEEEFAQLYSNVINVILSHIPDTWTAEDIRAAAERVVQFD
jgi:hypothetical protein